MSYTILPCLTKRNGYFVTLYKERGTVFFSAALYRAMREPKYVVAGQKDEFTLPVRKSGTSRYVKICGIEFNNANVIPNRCPVRRDGQWWYLIGIKIK